MLTTRNHLAAWMLAVPLAFVHAMPASTVDETQVANYVPWFPSSKVPNARVTPLL